jgi:hypothetical protein
MDALGSYEMLVTTYKITRRRNPESRSPNNDVIVIFLFS